LPGDHDSSHGWVKLHRQINDCAALEGPACPKWAWADLILLAAHRPVSVVVDRGDSGWLRVELQRGEFCLSCRFLAHRWTWGKTSVERFLIKLIREGMLTWRPAKLPQAQSQADLFDSLLTGAETSQKGLKAGPGYRARVPIVHLIANYEIYQHNPVEVGPGYRDGSLQEVSLPSEVIYTKRTTESMELYSKGPAATSLPGDRAPNPDPPTPLLRELGDLWNSLPGLIHHGRPALRAFDRKLTKALQLFGPDLLKLAFTRYSKWRVNREGRYRAAYSWTLGEFVSRSDGSHVARLSSDSWESSCLPFGNETQEQANTRAQARSAAGADRGPAGDVPGDGPAWLRWGGS
jgi:hypothetical protein